MKDEQKWVIDWYLSLLNSQSNSGIDYFALK